MNSTSKPLPFGSDFIMKYIPWKKWSETCRDENKIECQSNPEEKGVFKFLAKWKFTDSAGKVTYHGITSKHKSTKATKKKQTEYMVALVNAYTDKLSIQIATNTGVDHAE